MQSDLIQLQPLLSRLKLTGILEILEQTIKQALSEKWNYSKLLLHLFSNEIDKRDHNQSCRRLSKSN
jgi:DNA replication protein DnaC